MKEAKAWGASTETAIRENRHFPHRRASRTSFDTLVKRYGEFLDDAKLANADARKQHLAWFTKKFSRLTLGEVTPDRVAEARDALAAEKFTRGKPRKDKKTGEMIAPAEYKRSGATINRYLATLSHAFSLATKEWRLVASNPVRDITKKKEARGRVRFLSDEERIALLAACDASQWKPLLTLVQLALTTGARRGELIRLKWADVSLDPKAARATIHDTKNSDRRVLPLVGKALEALRALKLQNSARSAYVFPAPTVVLDPATGKPQLDAPYENFDAHWYDALTAAGLNNLHFHDLRHSCASYLAAQGASLLEIADVLGHRTMQMVKRYSHLTQSHKVAAIEAMVKAKGL